MVLSYISFRHLQPRLQLCMISWSNPNRRAQESCPADFSKTKDTAVDDERHRRYTKHTTSDILDVANSMTKASNNKTSSLLRH